MKTTDRPTIKKQDIPTWKEIRVVARELIPMMQGCSNKNRYRIDRVLLYLANLDLEDPTKGSDPDQESLPLEEGSS
jgi:hypothetical protein